MAISRHGLTELFDRTALRSLMALPPRAQRVLAGRPVVIDGQTLAVDLQLMLRARELVRSTPPESLPILEARRELRYQQRLAGVGLSIGSVEELEVAGLPARLYVPRGAASVGPLLLFLHGGGWIYGDLESHDPACRFLAEEAGVRVLAVDYRLAPEHPYPAAYDDSVAAFEWLLAHADEVGADPARLAVGGDSAGGTLAATLALTAAERGWPLAFQLLIYPATDLGGEFPSHASCGEGFLLTRADMEWFRGLYLDDPGQIADPRVSPLRALDLAGLPPALIFTAGFDPLRDEGQAYAERLAAAGVKTVHREFDSLIHGFVGMRGALQAAARAMDDMVTGLRHELARLGR